MHLDAEIFSREVWLQVKQLCSYYECELFISHASWTSLHPPSCDHHVQSSKWCPEMTCGPALHCPRQLYFQ